MCTVTFIPIDKTSFVLTQNRDEHYSRPQAAPPEIYEINGKRLIFPKDTTGGGTWIAASHQRITCLLNGAFKPHIPMPPYRKSRGLIVLESFDFNTVEDFSLHFNLQNIEPFTMICAGFENEITVEEIRWDGNRTFYKKMPVTDYHIWSSASLYTDEMHAMRIKWLRDWVENRIKKLPEDILRFHHEAGDGDLRTNVMMNRDNILTSVSVSSIVVNNGRVVFHYEDLKSQSHKEAAF